MLDRLSPFADLEAAYQQSSQFTNPWENKRLQQLLKERGLFWEKYQDEVFNLFRKWTDDQALVESIQFEDNGRVVVAGDLALTNIEYFPSLIRRVGGKLSINSPHQNLHQLDFLEEVGSLELKQCQQIKSFESLKKVNGNLNIMESGIVSLPSLVEIDGALLAVSLKNFKSLPVLEKAGSINLTDSGITNLSSLKYVDGFLALDDTRIQAVPNLEVVKNDLTAINAVNLADLSSLCFVGGILKVVSKVLEELPNLEEVELSFVVEGSENFSSAPKLKRVGYDVSLFGTRLTGLPALVTVGGNLAATGVKTLTDFSQLKTVGSNMLIGGTSLNQLPNLEEIGVSLNLGRLAENGFAQFFPQLVSIGQDKIGNSVYCSPFTVIEEVRELRANGKIDYPGRVVFHE
jgi:hypothetical protein